MTVAAFTHNSSPVHANAPLKVQKLRGDNKWKHWQKQPLLAYLFWTHFDNKSPYKIWCFLWWRNEQFPNPKLDTLMICKNVWCFISIDFFHFVESIWITRCRYCVSILVQQRETFLFCKTRNCRAKTTTIFWKQFVDVKDVDCRSTTRMGKEVWSNLWVSEFSFKFCGLIYFVISLESTSAIVRLFALPNLSWSNKFWSKIFLNTLIVSIKERINWHGITHCLPLKVTCGSVCERSRARHLAAGKWKRCIHWYKSAQIYLLMQSRRLHYKVVRLT